MAKEPGKRIGADKTRDGLHSIYRCMGSRRPPSKKRLSVDTNFSNSGSSSSESGSPTQMEEGEYERDGVSTPLPKIKLNHT